MFCTVPESLGRDLFENSIPIQRNFQEILEKVLGKSIKIVFFRCNMYPSLAAINSYRYESNYWSTASSILTRVWTLVDPRYIRYV